MDLHQTTDSFILQSHTRLPCWAFLPRTCSTFFKGPRLATREKPSVFLTFHCTPVEKNEELLTIISSLLCAANASFPE